MATTPGTAPTTPADLPVTKVDFSCRLPVVTGTNTTQQGGFITFPAARLATDPAGLMYRTAEDDIATAASPVLHGDGVVPFYDRAVSRWLPVRATQALADGSGYAYVSWNAQTDVFTAHVVDVGSGSSQSFKVPAVWNPLIADYGAAGAYMVAGSALGGPGDGVWLLNTRTGAITQLGQIHNVWAVRHGYAWVARFDTRDKTVWPPMEIAPANSLVRIDLATGAETIWFYQAGVYPWLLALDSFDRPVVTNGNDIVFVDQPGSSGQLVDSGFPRLDYLQGDGDRLWFGGNRGIYLFRPGRGFQKVFAYNGDPSTSDRIEPAGFCQ